MPFVATGVLCVLLPTSCGKDNNGGPDDNGSKPKKYSIGVSVTGNTGGTVKAMVDGVKVTKAAAGATVTIEATPAADYVFDEWSVTAGGVTLSSATSATATFDMPEDNVAVAASFTEGDRGVEINGVTWATCNVDAPGTFAATPQDAGMFYQWSVNTGWSATEPPISTPAGQTWKTASEIPASAGAVWATDPCPAGWCVPTADERKTLIDVGKVDYKWETTPVAGRKYTDKTSGNSIFLPAAGRRHLNTGALEDEGVYGCYWSSQCAINTNDVLCLSFTSANQLATATVRTQGYSIRCVKK